MKKATIDLTDCKYLMDLHERIRVSLGFPEWYGKNWDALWDCLRYLFYRRGDFRVNIYGFMSLPEDLREYCKTMLEIFDDVHEETPNVVFELIS